MIKEKLQQLKIEAENVLKLAESEDELNQIKIKYLGRKGKVTQLTREMGNLKAEERPIVGQIVNEIKVLINCQIENKLTSIRKKLNEKNLKEEAIDVTLPGRQTILGHKHPISIVLDEMIDIFLGLGFQVAEGPEIELDYYNFEALNIPKDHPARDMQDTFYISSEVVLRTHTSPVQVRVMEKQKPPVRVIMPGTVYRRDADITHTPMFHQVEGLMVDEKITFGDLKGILTIFVHQMFSKNTSLRFRPSFFPFTEPSAEIDIQCVICKGSGCRVCSQTGWLEILGAGMVDPNLYKFVNYDSEKYTGFAFGIGIERIAMLRYGIDDIRLFFENDMRFLRQF